MQSNESAEMYLETIHVLSKTKSAVRSVDIAEHMNYSKPSVSRAVGLLKSQGHIVISEDGYISLTESGVAVAEKVFERHTVLSDILKSLGVDDDTAAKDACKIEHCISEQSFKAIKNFFENRK